jgi:3-deoxy-D-manno-octulosonate 8-phosphate phosphatase (KDO 8-P phosphatase)
MSGSEHLSDEKRRRLANTSMLLLDVDGVLTDGTISLSDSGDESKRFSVRDGFALVWCRRFGLKTGVISGRSSPATLRRCQDLEFDEIHLGKTRKLSIFEDICARHGLTPREIAYMGDDLLDLPILSRVGFAACPADAHAEVRRRVHFVSNFTGGHGAIREVVDLWLQVTNHWEESLNMMDQIGTVSSHD